MQINMQAEPLNMQAEPQSTTTKRWAIFGWATRLALVALVLQALMPLGQSVAQAAIADQGPSSSNHVMVICTQMGLMQKTIGADGQPQNLPASKAAWDCPICQAQISANLSNLAPAQLQPPLLAPMQRIAFASAQAPRATAFAPNPARAPPIS